jgi:hypothetical protein
MIRSPSFSRSSSSATTTISPRAMAAIASSIGSKRMSGAPAGCRGGFDGGFGAHRPVPDSRYDDTSCSTYLAMTSTSRLTRSPGRLAPSVVTSAVWGMIATVKPSSSGSTTVRLTPSTVTDPFSTR